MTYTPKSELQAIIAQIASPDSPVGMDAVYVHALILDKLTRIESRLDALERNAGSAAAAIVPRKPSPGGSG